jgi:hypothetical protein
MGAQDIDVGSLFRLALANGAGSVDALDKLLELHDRVQRRHAELEYASALAKFQEQCPAIPKDMEHGHLTQAGSQKKVRYSSFEQMLETMRPYLRANGFSVKFDGETDGDMLSVTCTLGHINGHRETSTFKLPTRAKSPAMSEQHAYSAARSFAKRVTLSDVTGITYTDPEDEDRDPTTITEGQAATLEALIEEVGQDKASFLKWQGVQRVGDVLARRYARAVQALEAKRKQ